jgi:DNA-binding transcriptional LysR family regulator
MIRTGAADLGLITLPIDEPDLVTVPAIEEELLLVTAPQHPLAQKKRIVAADIRGEQFVLFEPGSATRRVIDEFFVRDAIAPRIVMETENVEILKALVRANIGIGILPYQAVAREAVSGHFFTSRLHGRTLVRKTGWVYARASRVPRTVQEILRAFDHVKGKLKLSPPPRVGRPGLAPSTTRIALLGFGTVGQAVARLILAAPTWRSARLQPPRGTQARRLAAGRDVDRVD